MVRTPGLGLDRGERFCTPLAGSYDVVDSIEKHFAEDDAADRLKWVMGMPGPVLRMQQIFSTLNSTVFISRFGIASRMANLDVQVLKETNQCQLDMTHAFDMSFASIQRTFLSTAAGLDLENEATQRLALRHSTRGGKDTCMNQIIFLTWGRDSSFFIADKG